MGILLSLSITSDALAQKAGHRLLHTVDVSASDIRIDNLNNIYAQTSEYELTKFSSKGEELASFSNVQYGQLSFVDPGNPMNLLLYYRNQQNLVILDVSLSELRSINLSQLGYSDVPLVANAQDRHYWLFDNADGRLKRIDSRGKVLHSSSNLIVEYGITDPAFILARHNFVFLSDTASGIYVFDNYGQFYRKFPITGVEKFQFTDDQLIYYREGKLKALNLLTMEQFSYDVPGKNVKWAAWRQPVLFVHEHDAIHIYELMP